MSHQSPLRRLFPVLLCLVVACNDEDVSNLFPEFGFDESVTVDPTGEADRVVDFGEVTLGTTRQRTLVLKNLGRSALSLEAFTLDAPFEVEHVPTTIDPEGSVPVTLHFVPTAEGTYTQKITLSSDGGGGTVRVVGKAVKRAGACLGVVNPGSVVFGNTAPGTQLLRTVAIENPGEETCTVESVSLSATSSAAFEILSAPASGSIIGQGGSSNVHLRFAPQAAGRDLVGVLVVKLSPGNVEKEVPLSGDGIESCPDPLEDGTCPVATSPVYANTGKALYRYDPVEGVTQKIGDFKADGVSSFSMTDIGIDAAGVMFGVSSNKLWVVNPETARCAEVASLPNALKSADGLTVLPDGRLVVADDQLVVVNRNTAQIVETLVGKNAGYDTAGDVIALPDGKLYWSVRGGDSNKPDRLLRVDPDDGQITDLGEIGQGVFGLAWADGVFFGFTKEGRLLVIDPTDGDVEDNSKLAGDWWGATSNPAQW